MAGFRRQGIRASDAAEVAAGRAEPHRQLQLKRGLAELSYADQMELVRPQSNPSFDEPVQRSGGGTGLDTEGMKETAQIGVRGASQSLPHLAPIQHAFGRHDVTGVKTVVGGSGEAASARLGAVAYTTGDRVAFKSSPQLHTAAHEAAHVVQQRAGVQLEGGVGKSGDSYERHADAVADQVVQHKSAESLLDSVVGGGVGLNPVQRTEDSSDGEVPVNLPNPVDANGEIVYYPDRVSDFGTRYKDYSSLSAPTYYMEYGHKYVKRFKEELRQHLSPEGQAWLDQTAINLQAAIEDRRAANPAAFDQLEKNDGAFTAFAYGSHADAYWDAGLANLNVFDLARVGLTPDVKDLLTKEGLKQVFDIGTRLLSAWGESAVDYVAGDGATEKLVEKAYEGMQYVGDGIDHVFGEGTSQTLIEKAGELKDEIENLASSGYDIAASVVGYGVDAVDSVFGEGTVERLAQKGQKGVRKVVDTAERTYNWAKGVIASIF